MKIGIITFSASDNYGAMLQAYALQEYICGLGHKAFIIDYRPEYKLRNYKPFRLDRWFSKSPIKTIIKMKEEAPKLICRWLRHKRANDFRKQYLNLYPYKEGMGFNEFDAIILGGDQIWNPRNTNNHLEDIFWGVGAKCKVISYAPSMGRATISDSEKSYIISALENIDFISVRESSMIDVLQPLTTKRITHVIDPTYLADRVIYNEITERSHIKFPYILLFDLFEREKTYSFAKQLAEDNNCRLIRLQGTVSYPFWKKDTLQTASVARFLGLIKDAKCIVTSSFHAMAFSIIFNRPFYCIKQNSPIDLRAISVLDSLQLSDRMIVDTERIELTKIDYKQVEDRIKGLSLQSKLFLDKALS